MLIILSGACFIVGTAFLAKSIRWMSDDMRLNGTKIPTSSPGRTNRRKLITGTILTAIGYGLLVISTGISP